MAELEKKFSVFKKALASLDRSVNRYEESKTYEGERFEDYRDSLIQRFEYCTDLLWKVLKKYLEEKHGVIAKSPKSVFRECFSVGILDEGETENFLHMIDARNTTSHMYKEEIADKLYVDIPVYYNAMESLINSIS